jgi:3-dehydroquinate synthase
MNEVTVPVVLDTGSYDIRIGTRLIDRAGNVLAAQFPGRSCRIVTDEVVAGHYLQALQQSLGTAGLQSGEAVVLPSGEATKSFRHYEAVCENLLASRIDRQTVLIALGGGVIGDLTGFVAATLLRGLDFVQLPTTLLAQVDSSVGGKTGINTKAGKNLAGAFHQPKLVLADLDTLATLPARELRAGYAEVVKHGVALDAEFFAVLEKNGPALLAGDKAAQLYAVQRSCELKAGVVARDPHEHGERALLNFGHTFGHALEALLGYDGRLLHGEGVAIGMILALDLSVQLGLCPQDDLARAKAHYAATGLPLAIDPAWGLTPDAIIAAMATDKKAKNGQLRFILSRGIGEAFVAEGVAMDQVAKMIIP